MACFHVYFENNSTHKSKLHSPCAIPETMLFLSWPRVEQGHVFKIYCRVGPTKLEKICIMNL